MNNFGIEKPHIFTETSINVIIWKKKLFVQDSDFQFGTGIRIPQWQFWSADAINVAPTARQTLTSLVHFVLGSSWKKVNIFPKKLGLRKMGAKLPWRLIRVFLGLWAGESLFPHQLLWPVKAVTPEPLDFHLWMWNPAQPHLNCLNLLFPPLEGESGCEKAPCKDGVESHIPQREKCVGEETCFGMTWKQKLSLRKDVKLVANLTSSGAASISSVNFIPEANKLQWEGI